MTTLECKNYWMAVATLILSACLGASAVRADTFAYDGFDYDPGVDGLLDADGGAGWSEAWESPGADVAEGSLLYSDSEGNRLRTSGNHIAFANSEATISNRRVLDISKVPDSLVEEGRLGKDGTSVWLSFLMRTEGAPDPAWGGVSLFDEDFAGGADGSNKVDVGIKDDNDGADTFGMGFPGNPEPGRVQSDVPVTDQSFIVARFDFHELVDPDTNDGEDEIFMWVNPRLDQLPDDSDALFLPFRRHHNASDQEASFMFDRIRVSIGRGDQGVLDEIRFGETFTDVAPTFGLLGDINVDGQVDLADFTIMADNFRGTFSVGEALAKGDLTGEGDINLQDFVLFRRAFHEANPPAGAQSVPEPGSAVLLVCLVGGMAFRRRRRSLGWSTS